VKLGTAQCKTVTKAVRLYRASAFGWCAFWVVSALGAIGTSSFALNAVHDNSANRALEFVAFKPGVHLLHLKLAEIMMVETCLIVRIITEAVVA